MKPARFLCPWDSPGRNAEVGCHFLLPLPDPGIEPRGPQGVLTWQAGPLPSETSVCETILRKDALSYLCLNLPGEESRASISQDAWMTGL